MADSNTAVEPQDAASDKVCSVSDDSVAQENKENTQTNEVATVTTIALRLALLSKRVEQVQRLCEQAPVGGLPHHRFASSVRACVDEYNSASEQDQDIAKEVLADALRRDFDNTINYLRTGSIQPMVELLFDLFGEEAVPIIERTMGKGFWERVK